MKKIWLLLFGLYLVNLAFAQDWVLVKNETINSLGNYGTRRVSNHNNYPPARSHSIYWSDSKDRFWLYGGGSYSDMWFYENQKWTWFSGAKGRVNQKTVYGKKGQADTLNTPGVRRWSSFCVDQNDNLWVFGGEGWDIIGEKGFLNDLWKWNGKAWTWVAGDNTINRKGNYYTKGKENTISKPGARTESAMAIDPKSGDVYVFGGFAFDSDSFSGFMNDLWCYNGKNWTWLAGAKKRNVNGIYKSSAVNQRIGARGQAISFFKGGELHIVGGWDSQEELWFKTFNDTWKWSNSKWYFLNGDTTSNSLKDEIGILGNYCFTLDQAYAIRNQELYSFGGAVSVNESSFSSLNQLVVNNTNQQTYLYEMADKGLDIYGNYDSGNKDKCYPGARNGAALWVDSLGHVYIFGGMGNGAFPEQGLLSDIWKFADNKNSIDKHQVRSFSMYPNPASKLLHIHTSVTDYKLSLYNSQGQKVQHLNSILNKQVLNISELPNGLYYLKFDFDSKSELYKIVVKH
jgi:N-acetylneuraminic acid mutarotase